MTVTRDELWKAIRDRDALISRLLKENAVLLHSLATWTAEGTTAAPAPERRVACSCHGVGLRSIYCPVHGRRREEATPQDIIPVRRIYDLKASTLLAEIDQLLHALEERTGKAHTLLHHLSTRLVDNELAAEWNLTDANDTK